MILAHTNNGLLVVRQPEHGRQTGLFARSWGNECVAPVRAWQDSIQLASTHHDDGWSTWELYPTLDPTTRQPVQFHSVTPFEHIPLYRTGITRVAAIDPLAGILVSMHGAGLYNDRYGTFRLIDLDLNAEEQFLVKEFLQDMQAFQGTLAASIGLHTDDHVSVDPEIRNAYLLLQVWDRLSLQFLYHLTSDGIISPLPIGDGTTTELRCQNVGAFHLALEPYPFQESSMVFPVLGVTVPDRRYKTPEDFLESVRDAREWTIECRVTPF